ncbi:MULTISPECIES: hypothetical protein [unclassified Moraxella]|uniref:anti-sigma factor family protein n=1 Tax=unclassified Moraxella TaxID=2685852 RepID=UPI00359CE4B5
MKSCQKISQLASLSLEKSLSLQQKAYLILHFAVCRHCRTFDKNNKILSSMLKNQKQADETLLDTKKLHAQQKTQADDTWSA